MRKESREPQGDTGEWPITKTERRRWLQRWQKRTEPEKETVNQESRQ